MAVNLNWLFARKDVFPSWWANAVQQALTGVSTLHISKKSATVIQVIPHTDLEVAGVQIEGKWRFNQATIERTVSGAKATYNIYAVAKKNEVDNSPAVFTDHTTYTWELRVSATKPEGAGIDITQKIGEVDWSGTEIEAIRQTYGRVDGAQVDASTWSSGGDLEWKRDSTGAWTPTAKVASISDAKLASPNNGIWRELLTVTQPLTGALAAGSYFMGSGATPTIIGGGSILGGIPSFPFYKEAELTATGKSMSLRIVATLYTNATAPGSEIVVGLAQIASVAGGSNLLTATGVAVALGNTVFFGNTKELKTPKIGSGFSPVPLSQEASIVFYVKLPSALAANAAAVVSAQLQMANV